MEIWKPPKPNLENPTKYVDGGRSYWEVWNSLVSLAVFARNQGPE